MPERADDVRARMLANDMVDLLQTMQDLLHGLVDLSRQSKQLTPYPFYLPPTIALDMACTAQGMGLATLATWLQQIGTVCGAKYTAVGMDALTSLRKLEKDTGVVLDLNLDEPPA